MVYGCTIFRGIPAKGGGVHADPGIKSSPVTDNATVIIGHIRNTIAAGSCDAERSKIRIPM